MKTLVLSVLVLLIVSSSLLGQSLPIVVDNSSFVPPVRVQYWNSCQPYSIVYYLKSYIWNREFNRNPGLLQNQFNPYFVWNQAVTLQNNWTNSTATILLMKEQGCGTADMFPMPENPPFEYQAVMPDLLTREAALKYRSRDLKNVRLRNLDSVSAYAEIAKLRDSLSHGVCFTISLPIFCYMSQLYSQGTNPAVYKCLPGLSRDSMQATHQAMVVGYDDNLQAFKLVNSWGEEFGNQGYFYLDYRWLYGFTQFIYDVNFLYEDFHHDPKFVAYFSITDYINGDSRTSMDYVVIDTTYYRPNVFDWVDFTDIHYGIYSPNLIRLKSINGTSVIDNPLNIFMSVNSPSGSYSIITDLTDKVSTDNLHSASILVMDPISGTYNGEGGVLYEYARTPQAVVANPYIKLPLGVIMVGRIAELPDTTVIKEDYNSSFITYHIPGVSRVTTSVCTFKRYLVTFDIADTVVNNAPVFTAKPDTLKTKPDSMVTFQFAADDPDGDSLRYSVSGEGATINPITGLFQYRSSSLGSYDIKVYVSDGYNAVQDSFIVKVDNTVGVEDEDGSLSTKYSLSQNYPNPFNPSTVINFSVPKTGQVILKVYNILGQEITTLVNEEITVGSHSVRFDGSGLSSGLYLYSIEAENYRETKKMVLVK